MVGDVARFPPPVLRWDRPLRSRRKDSRKDFFSDFRRDIGPSSAVLARSGGMRGIEWDEWACIQGSFHPYSVCLTEWGSSEWVCMAWISGIFDTWY